MSFNYQAISQDVNTLMTEFGVLATYYSVQQIFNPLTEEMTGLDISTEIKVLFSQITLDGSGSSNENKNQGMSKENKNQNVHPLASVLATLPSSIIPKIKDYFIIDGKKFNIQSIKVTKPADVVLLYEFEVSYATC